MDEEKRIPNDDRASAIDFYAIVNGITEAEARYILKNDKLGRKLTPAVNQTELACVRETMFRFLAECRNGVERSGCKAAMKGIRQVGIPGVRGSFTTRESQARRPDGCSAVARSPPSSCGS